MIYHILYISEQTESFTDDDLEKIVSKSSENNKVKNVTGMLIKNGKFFIQLLEGKKEAVMEVYNRIARDPRHTRLRNLIEHRSDSRIFPSWHMGLVNAKEHELTIQELVPLLNSDILKVEKEKDKIISILKKFNSF